MKNTPRGQELGLGQVTWQAQRLWRETGSPGGCKGRRSQEENQVCLEGRDKAKLMRRSLEARLLGEDFKPEWEKLLGGGHAAWEDWELSLWAGQGLRESLLGKGEQMGELEWGRGGGPQG